jgi:predicted nucleic acid-binding protein
MALRLSRTAVVDTCFWFALCDRNDQYHQQALAKEELLHSLNLIIPWPCLYETLNTSFVKNPRSLGTFERFRHRPNVDLADDGKYRDTAYQETFVLARKRPISLVDMVIRCILDDVNIRKDCLLTFNQPDFVDICRKRQIELI